MIGVVKNEAVLSKNEHMSVKILILKSIDCFPSVLDISLITELIRKPQSCAVVMSAKKACNFPFVQKCRYETFREFSSNILYKLSSVRCAFGAKLLVQSIC